MRATVILITHNARHHLPHCLPKILSSTIQPQVLLVNSSSGDGTVEEAKRYGVDTFVIPRVEFNHGATRELARKRAGGDIAIFMTPDAYLASPDALEKLIHPLIEGKAEASYARQLPHKNAKGMEAFQRSFNYPKESHIRSIADVKRFGSYTFFCSNSCAAYVNQALDLAGGFSPVLLGEDTLAVAKMLRSGMRIAYAADALVHHSHSYNIKQEFQRSFDTGLARASYASLLYTQGGDEELGKLYVKRLIGTLARENPAALPYAIVHTAAKAAGYYIGKKSLNASSSFLRLLSSQDFFWNSIYSDCMKSKGSSAS